jgi:hypothetical protein
LPDVSITRVIGIATITALILAVGFFAANMSMRVSQDTSKSSLQEVTEKVSSEFIDLLALISLHPNSTLFFKVINIPDSINNGGYLLSLQKDSQGWKVVAYLNENAATRAESNLYFNGGVYVISGTGNFYVNYNLQNVTLSYGTSLQSGTYRPVVWCQINPTNITVGLGSLGVKG